MSEWKDMEMIQGGWYGCIIHQLELKDVERYDGFKHKRVLAIGINLLYFFEVLERESNPRNASKNSKEQCITKLPTSLYST